MCSKPRTMYLNINNIIVEYTFPDSKIISRFLYRDFSDFKLRLEEKKSLDDISLKVVLVNETFTLPKEYLKLKEGLIFFDGTVALRSSAKLRKYWITIGINNKNHYLVKIYLDIYKDSLINDISALVFPNAMSILENIIFDFNHGLMIGLLHSLSLLKKSAVLHAAAVEYNGKGIVFPGLAQVGKTSVIDSFYENEKGKFLGEDFIFLEKGMINGFPRQRRIFLEDSRVKCKTGLEFVNKVFYSLPVLRKKSKRIRAWNEIYSGDFFLRSIELDRVVFLQRVEGKQHLKRDVSCEYMAELCANMMLDEFFNLSNYREFIYAQGLFSSQTFSKLLSKTKECYLQLFQGKQCEVIEIKTVVDYDDFFKFLLNVLDKGDVIS